MYLRLSVLLLVAAVSLTAARFEDELKDRRTSPETNDLTVDRHRPVIPKLRPLVLIPENYPEGELQHNADLVNDGEFAVREPRSVRLSSLSRPGPRRPNPSPTFPKPPTSYRFRREAADDADESVVRIVRSIQPYNPHRPSPVPRPSPTFPRPEDLHRPVLARFKRGGGRVSVDVEKSRGSKPTTRVTAEHNVYRSGDGRTRVDASAHATNRGDRGGMINFSHRF